VKVGKRIRQGFGNEPFNVNPLSFFHA